MIKSKALRWLSAATAAGMYIVMLQGSLVTNTGSRYGCGQSWPLCHGKFIPEYTIETLIEYSHRSVSGLVGFMVVALAVWMWRTMGARPWVRPMAATAVAFTMIQAALGALVVLVPQPKWVLAGHFGISLVAYGASLLLAVLVYQGNRPAAEPAPVSERLRRWVYVVTAYTMAVVYTGAYVRHTSSDLACGVEWPLCNGQVLPPLAGPVGIQFAHRLAAGAAVVLIARLAWLAWQERRERSDVYLAAVGALALILAQAGSGAIVVLTQLTLGAKMLHATLIVGLWGVLCYLCMQVTPASLPATFRTAAAGD